MLEKPTLFVCHGDDGGPRFHHVGAFKKRFEARESNI